MTTTSSRSSGVLLSYEVRTYVPHLPTCSLTSPLGHKYIRPKSIHDPDTTEEFSKHYMYLACIQFINSVKTASLRWHSPMLDDISAVRPFLSFPPFLHTLNLPYRIRSRPGIK